VKLSVQMMSSRLFKHVGRVVRKTQIAKTQQTLKVLGGLDMCMFCPYCRASLFHLQDSKRGWQRSLPQFCFAANLFLLKMCDHACRCSCNPSIMFMSSHMCMCFHVHVIHVQYVHMFQHGHVSSCSCLSMYVHVHVHVS